MPYPVYSILSEIAVGKVSMTKLDAYLRLFGPSDYSGLAQDSDALTICYTRNLSTEEREVVTDLVWDHDGIPSPEATSLAMSTLVSLPISIMDSEWVELGGVITNPSFFESQLALLIGRITGEVLTDGEMEFRLVEVLPESRDVKNSVPWLRGATGGLWQSVQFSSDVPAHVGEHPFVLEGRLNSGTLGQIRFVSLVLLKVVSHAG